MKKFLGFLLCMMLLVFGVSIAGAITYEQIDLTTGGKGQQELYKGAYFIVFDDDMQETISSGTGVIDPFLTIQAIGFGQ